MNETRTFILCSARLAIPSIRNLVMSRLLCFVGIPSHCKELVEELTGLLQPFNVPVIILEKKDFATAVEKAIAEHKATLGFVITFSYKIPQSLAALPANGLFNVHPGPLPQYRGADPVFQQIKNREAQAGVTIHHLAEAMDAGPVVIREMTRLFPEDTYGILDARLGELAGSMIGTIIKMIALGITPPSKPQDESQARYFKRQTQADIVIDWEKMDAASIVALINACNPWNKGAVTMFNNKIIRLLQASEDPLADNKNAAPGTIVAISENVLSVAVKPAGTLNIGYLYTDEGFLQPGTLIRLGVQPGGHFKSL